YHEPLTARLARWGRLHKPWVTGAAALLLVSVVALAVGLWVVNRERQRTTAERDQRDAALEAEGHERKRATPAIEATPSQIIEDWLAQQKELSPKHKQFLEQALRYYEEFAADTGQQEESRAGVAHAYGRVGVIRQRLGLRTDAETAFQRSRDLYAELA